MIRICRCPVCNGNAVGCRDWSAADWAKYSRPGGMVVCPFCASLLVFAHGPSLREPTAWEWVRIYSSRDWEFLRRRREQLTATAAGGMT